MGKQLRMRTRSRIPLITFLALIGIGLAGCTTLPGPLSAVRFIDSETGRGIPLVEMVSIHGVRHISDSAGYIALSPVGSGNDTRFFRINSDGYKLSSATQGSRAIQIDILAGQIHTIPMDRVNIAERLYRITGEGIYHHSIALNLPFAEDQVNAPAGGVYGQDSVQNAIYKNKLYWFWGDTKRGEHPLGNFKTAGAISALPAAGGKHPDEGVDLNYFVDDSGFTRQMCPIEGPGVVWISGVTVIREAERERMLCYFTRRKGMGKEFERGLALWNDDRNIFEKIIAYPPDLRRHPLGHPVSVVHGDETWLYFSNVLPWMRVKATFDHIIDPDQYEVFSMLRGDREQAGGDYSVRRDSTGELAWAWHRDGIPVDTRRWKVLESRGLVSAEEYRNSLVDMETGDRIVLGSGHIAWNEFRQKWILIAGQKGGRSFLGETWYAEADSPMGPWSRARRIVSHDQYSFYGVKQHPYFAHDKYIYFEGSYTRWFSGVAAPTPRYDYNQIMYRLNLEDERLSPLGEAGAVSGSSAAAGALH